MQNSSAKPTLTIFIPAYNEEKNIQKIITDCLAIKEYIPDVLVIVDSKTTDKTEQIASKTKARIIRVKKSLGKGTNIREGSKSIKGEYVIQIDADYQFLPSDIPRLVEPLRNGYDVALGTRYRTGAKIEIGAVSTLKLFGSFTLSLITSILIDQRVTDVMAGFKAFRTSAFKKLPIESHHFGYEVELIIKAKKKKMKILEVPISYKKRVIGTSSVNSIKHGLLVMGTILKTSFSK